MKANTKIFLLTVVAVVLTFSVFSQTEPEAFSLQYDGLASVNDKIISEEGDTIYKVGSFSSNQGAGQVFFGLTDFQFGLFGIYGENSSLTSQYSSQTTQYFGGGFILRQNFDFLELKIGAGYLKRNKLEGGYKEASAGTGIYDYFGDTLSQSRIFIPVEIIISHEWNLLPKVKFSGNQRFCFLETSGQRVLAREDMNFSLDVSLYKVNIFPEIYISPLVSYERNELTITPIYKVGAVVSGKYLRRTDILKVGYFHEKNVLGTEGFFISFNVLGLISAFQD